MWDDRISEMILKKYEEYAINERKQFTIEVPHGAIQGGLAAINKLLERSRVAHDTTVELYSDHPFSMAKKIADAYYADGARPLTQAKPMLAGRRFEVMSGTRLLATIYVEGTAKASALHYRGELFVAPTLLAIDLLHNIYDPHNVGDDSRELLGKLTARFLGAYIRNAIMPKCDIAQVQPDMRHMLVVYTAPDHIILISDRESDDDVSYIRSKWRQSAPVVHAVRLPRENFMKKITVRLPIAQRVGGRRSDRHTYKREDQRADRHAPSKARGGGVKYSIYNIGSYELLPYYLKGAGAGAGATASTYCEAYSSVIARMLLIEDNTFANLVANGHIPKEKAAHTKPLASMALIKHALEEEYPRAFGNDILGFFGKYISPIAMERIFAKTQEKKRSYFPAYENRAKKMEHVAAADDVAATA
jgi:hypothetical protein